MFSELWVCARVCSSPFLEMYNKAYFLSFDHTESSLSLSAKEFRKEHDDNCIYTALYKSFTHSHTLVEAAAVVATKIILLVLNLCKTTLLCNPQSIVGYVGPQRIHQTHPSNLGKDTSVTTLGGLFELGRSSSCRCDIIAHKRGLRSMQP